MEDMMDKNRILLVGSGLSNAVIATCLSKYYDIDVFEQSSFIGGFCYTENIDGIMVHKYGPHIFKTSNKSIWDFVNKFSEFNNFINSPIACYHGRMYNLPFNMNTFTRIWSNVSTPDEARNEINREIKKSGIDPNRVTNLEEKAISMVGTTIYEMLVRDYTEKQWGRSCKDLPPHIISRLPLRFTFDNNYFNARYQGIPVDGYTSIINKMFKDCNIYRNRKFNPGDLEYLSKKYKYIIYSGRVDELFGFSLGTLEFRGLYWTHNTIENCNNFQGNAVVNYTSHDVDYTRLIEHKHFTFGDNLDFTIVSEEYSVNGNMTSSSPCYPIETKRNLDLQHKYESMLKSKYGNVILSGRLGQYKYYNMDDAISSSIRIAENILKGL